jgi:ABC-type uncharacterized transport system substrate-binding protein
VIVAGGAGAAFAAKAATTTIPIVFNTGGDPIKMGLVASLGRPGGNATGLNIFTTDLAAKRLSILRELVPTSALIGVLFNPNNPTSEAQSKEVQEAARALGQEIRILQAGSEEALGPTFTTMARERTGGKKPHVQRSRDVDVRAERLEARSPWRQAHAALGGPSQSGSGRR